MKSKPRDCGNYWRSLPILINIDQILLWSDLWAYDEFGRWFNEHKKEMWHSFSQRTHQQQMSIFFLSELWPLRSERHGGGVGGRSSVLGKIFKLPKDFTDRSSSLGLFFCALCLLLPAVPSWCALVLGIQGCFFIDPIAMVMMCVA